VQSGLAFFSIHVAHPFLNFQVGVRQRGFRIKGVKCIGRNLFLAICSNSGDSGWSEFGQTSLTVFISGIDLIVKTHKKKIPSYHWFSGTAHLLHHNRCLFLRTWYWKDT